MVLADLVWLCLGSQGPQNVQVFLWMVWFWHENEEGGGTREQVAVVRAGLGLFLKGLLQLCLRSDYRNSGVSVMIVPLVLSSCSCHFRLGESMSMKAT